MPTVKIAQSVPLDAKDCYERVSKMLENDRELKKLDPNFTCNFNSATLSGTAEGKQFKAKLLITPDGQHSQLDLQVELPFHLGLVKGLVQKTLEKKLGEVLG